MGNGNGSLEVLLKDALLVEALHIRAAADELAVYEAPGHRPRPGHLAEHRLDLVAVIPTVQLHHGDLHLQLPELLLGHAAVRAVALAEYDDLVVLDRVADEVALGTVHGNVEGGSLQGTDHGTHESQQYWQSEPGYLRRAC